MDALIFGYTLGSILACQQGIGHPCPPAVPKAPDCPQFAAVSAATASMSHPWVGKRISATFNGPGGHSEQSTGTIIDVVPTATGNLRIAYLRDDTQSPWRAYTGSPEWTISIET